MNETKKRYLFDHFKFIKTEAIDLGDGWFGIVRTLCEKLKALDIQSFEVIEIKEKDGDLCFYTKGVPERYRDNVKSLIEEAEIESKKTCEICGQPGYPRKTRYVTFIACRECIS
ncbi:MAG: hypothetical protein Q7S19_01615 [bacterium]|nr:hypothetical protein [bacterium]